MPSSLRLGKFQQLKSHEIKLVLDKGAQENRRFNSFGATPAVGPPEGKKAQAQQPKRGAADVKGFGGGGEAVAAAAMRGDVAKIEEMRQIALAAVRDIEGGRAAASSSTSSSVTEEEAAYRDDEDW